MPGAVAETEDRALSGPGPAPGPAPVLVADGLDSTDIRAAAAERLVKISVWTLRTGAGESAGGGRKNVLSGCRPQSDSEL